MPPLRACVLAGRAVRQCGGATHARAAALCSSVKGKVAEWAVRQCGHETTSCIALPCKKGTVAGRAVHSMVGLIDARAAALCGAVTGREKPDGKGLVTCVLQGTRSAGAELLSRLQGPKTESNFCVVTELLMKQQ